ncbi:hypothetical protein BS17DRAFT_820681 [Gyrodon lividus]|nr:hypothetical protein BS17DRAFT_820681 [Gyrodon lividus]
MNKGHVNTLEIIASAFQLVTLSLWALPPSVRLGVAVHAHVTSLPVCTHKAPTNAAIPEPDCFQSRGDSPYFINVVFADEELDSFDLDMKTTQNAAINSNEKIFPVFAKKLASKEPKDYINTAHKLAIWLTSEKAYYPAARPKIVELLEIAHATFVHEFLRHEGVVELAEHLQQLIRAVTPKTPACGATDEQVLASLAPYVRANGDRPSFYFGSSVSCYQSIGVSPPTTALLGKVPYPQPSMPSMPISQPEGEAAQPVSPPPATSASIKTESYDTTQVGAPQASSSAEAVSVTRPPDVEPSLAFPTISALQYSGASGASAVLTKPQPKRQRKAELPEELKARDLDWFKSIQSSLPAHEEPSASSSQAGGSSSISPGDQPSVNAPSPSPKRKTARMVPSRRLPRRALPLEVPPEVAECVTTSVLPPPATELSAEISGSTGLSIKADEIEDTFAAMDVDEQNPSPEVEAQPPTVGNSEEGNAPDDPAHDISHYKDPPQPDPPSVAPPSTEPPSIALLSAEPQPIIADPLPINVDPPAPAEPQILKTTAYAPPATTENTMESSLASNVEPSPFDTLPPESADISGANAPPPTVLRRDMAVPAPDTENTANPPLSTNFRITRKSPSQVPQGLADASRRKFGGNMVVMYGLQGKPFTSTHNIELNLSDPLFSNILKWVNRKIEPHLAARGVCISLACYRLPELFATIKSGSNERGIDDLTSRSSCSWPRSNSLSLHVKRNDKDTVISLAPPIFLTPDQCVDISSLMTSGRNTLELTQRGDLSEYAFVFHAHHPSQAQLAELAMVKASDEHWKHFLEALCMPAGLESP